MTQEIKTFNLKSTISEAEFKAAEPVKVGKVFSPGKYDLQIIEASLNTSEANPEGRSKGDPTWLVYRIKLGDALGRSITTFVLAPTEDLTYKKPGMKKEHRLLMANKFKEFVKGIGENASVDNLGNVLNKLFASPEALVGKVATALIGYKNNYISYNPESKSYQIVNRKGESVIKRTYQDRDAAVADSAELGIEIQLFPEVTRFLERR